MGRVLSCGARVLNRLLSGFILALTIGKVLAHGWTFEAACCALLVVVYVVCEAFESWLLWALASAASDLAADFEEAGIELDSVLTARAIARSLGRISGNAGARQ